MCTNRWGRNSRLLYRTTKQRAGENRRAATPSVFPAKARIHVPSLMAHPRLSGESRNPRPLPGVRLPTSRRRRRHPRLSGESRNPRPLPDGPPPSFRRKPESTSPPRRPFARQAGIHVPSPASVCPQVGIYAATPPVFPAKAGIHVTLPDGPPLRLSGESRNPRRLPGGPPPSFRRKPGSTSPARRPFARELA